jgi:hypothetical protein
VYEPVKAPRRCEKARPRVAAERHRRWKTGVVETICRAGVLTAADEMLVAARRMVNDNCEAMVSVVLECRSLRSGRLSSASELVMHDVNAGCDRLLGSDSRIRDFVFCS